MEVRRRAQLGELRMLEEGKQNLADHAREWWATYAEPNLARKTLVMYASLWTATYCRGWAGSTCAG